VGNRRLHGILVLMSLLATGYAVTCLAQSASQVAAITLLRSDRFQELDDQFSRIQRGYEQGSVTEEHLADEFRAFYDTDPDLEKKYNSWIEQLPRSYVARLARGIY
jgi:hypothetical protein